MDREKQIAAELKKLQKLYAKIPENKRKLCEGLLQNAAFMKVTLGELQADIVAHGAMIEYQSGNGFETLRDNPAQKSYTTMIARYSGIINQLLGLLPPEEVDDDPLKEFR